MPSTVSPWLLWNERTARAVTGPKLPVGFTPSARWIAATLGPELPRRSSPPPAASESGAAIARSAPMVTSEPRAERARRARVRTRAEIDRRRRARLIAVSHS